MSKPGLLLIGAGGHARACIDVIEQLDTYRIVGLVGMPTELNDHCLGYQVIASDEDLPKLAKEYQHALIVVGQIHSPETRIRLYERVAQLGFSLPQIVAPDALVSRHANVGAGTVVMHGAIVNAGASVGENCIINSRVLIEHDATIGGHCHIATGAIVNGAVNVGVGSFVGSGSIIKECTSIGQRCLVGMGLAVRHDLADYTRYVGN